MITEMKKYSFLVFHRDYPAFLEAIRGLGVVHISLKADGMAEDEQMQQLLSRTDEVKHLLAAGAPEQLLRERGEIEARIAATEKEAERMAVWGEFSAAKLASLREAGYVLSFYTTSLKDFRAEWGIEVNRDKSQVYFVAVNKQGSEPELSDMCVLQQLNEKSTADLRKDIDGLQGLLAAANARIELWQKENIAKLEQELKQLQSQIGWQQVVLSTDSPLQGDGAGLLCMLEGFCPVDKEQALNELLAREQVYYEVTAPSEEDRTPIKLRNNKFTKLFEPFTGMYGWPTYGEFDPTPVLAPFYLLFFAMCLGDAGYGLILIIFGLLTHYKKVNIEMFDGQGPIIAVLGAGTTVVGLILGTFFGISLYDAAWYPEVMKKCILHGDIMGFDLQMVASLVIGVIHICLAMIIKSVCYTKRFGLKENLGTWGWTLLIVGGIILAAVAMGFGLPAMVTKCLVIALAVVSGLGIFIFNKPGRNPLINVGAGLYDTYNVASGLISDVLSYVRLYALGLSGGILGSTFNTLGLMLIGDTATTSVPMLVLEIAFAAIILLFGHVLNILLSSLGAFVHPLRLTFVEYFKNAGYEGKGEEYKPFKM